MKASIDTKRESSHVSSSLSHSFGSDTSGDDGIGPEYRQKQPKDDVIKVNRQIR